MNHQSNSNRIAKNTVLLYFRSLFVMSVSLYTSRIILNTLGLEDYGIYNVIGGVVAMFTLLSGSLSSYELIQMILEKNNMHEFDVANIYKCGS